VRAHRRQKRRQRNMQIMRAALPYIAHAPSSFICTGSHSLCVLAAESSLSAKFCSLCVYVYVFIFPLLAHIRHYFCTSEVYLKKKCHSYPSYYHSLFVFPYCERESALKWRRRQMDEREWERPQLSHYMCARAENSFGHDGENNNKFVLQRVKNTLCVCVWEREWVSERVLHTELLKQPRGVLFIFLLLFKSASKVQKLHLSQPLSSPLSSRSDIISSLGWCSCTGWGSIFLRCTDRPADDWNENKLVVARCLDFEQKGSRWLNAIHLHTEAQTHTQQVRARI
jgi:hypothetical protein